ncbi:MAG TPA: efflux RND transporter periplasmic adaptor subunit [Ignavibacteria bacterium]|nr:efflux RND transporter periplasmic adaptor subunit [Ignavibacteria bacterium]
MAEENTQKVKVKAVLSDSRKRKRKKRIITFSVLALFLIIIIAVLLTNKKEKLVEVQTEKVSRRNIVQTVTATGKVQAEKKVNISAEVSGEIIALPFKEGDEVKQNDLVVKIKPDVYYPQIRQQEAGIKVLESTLKAQEVSLRKNELDLNRIKELRGKGLASQSDLDNTQAAYDATLAAMNTTRAQIGQQQASLAAVQYDMSKTTIYAPMSGVITQKNNEIGEKVLGTMSNMGNNILTISDLSSMECDVDVSESDVTSINLGDTAKIQIDAFPDVIMKGTVFEIANTATAKNTGTQEEVVNFTVKIRVINEGYDLRPGMSCTVDIEVNKKNDVLAVPIQSVTAREGDTTKQEGMQTDNPELTSTKQNEQNLKKSKPKEIVFLIENGSAKKRSVKTGISDVSYIEIIDGLSGNEDVVKGSYKAINKDLDENVKVKVNNDVKKPAPNTEQ